MRTNHRLGIWIVVLGLATACSGDDDDAEDGGGSDGPGATVNPNVHAVGDAEAGRDVFRFETFGNEGFWTDAVRLPQGIVAAGVTPLDALSLGLSVDVTALDAATQQAIADELETDLSPAKAPLLNDPDTTVALVNANAVIGLVVKDTSNDGVLDVLRGDKVGASCALCHTITDGAVLTAAGGGSIGRRQDGRAPHDLDFGDLVAFGENSRALYPLLQLALDAHGGASIGRAAQGLTEKSTEAEVDAYLRDDESYPVGTFDDTFDGNGDPMRNPALFRADLAAPWGSEGSVRLLDDFSNLVYTGLLDPTNLTTADGRAYLELLLGAGGVEMADEYAALLADTGVKGFPYVRALPHPVPGSPAAPLGIRVDETKLLDLNAYLNQLGAPPGTPEPEDAVARGRDRFRQSCTQCHNVDQSVFVPPDVVAMETIWPGDDPELVFERPRPLYHVVNSPGTFDDKMAVVNAQVRGLARGIALPLLLDLARKPSFLHDGSVRTLDDLLDPARGADAPHPFYEADPDVRADLAAFLRSLDTNSP